MVSVKFKILKIALAVGLIFFAIYSAFTFNLGFGFDDDINLSGLNYENKASTVVVKFTNNIAEYISVDKYLNSSYTVDSGLISISNGQDNVFLNIVAPDRLYLTSLNQFLYLF